MAHEPPLGFRRFCHRPLLGIYTHSLPDDSGRRHGDSRTCKHADLRGFGLDYQSPHHAPHVLFQLHGGYLADGQFR